MKHFKASSKQKIYFNNTKVAKPGAWQKQIKTKMAAVNKKLKFVILQQVNVISILLLKIIAASEYYQCSTLNSRINKF